MKFYLHHAYLNTTRDIDILNATHDMKRALRESQIIQGSITIYINSSTAGVVILENDPSIHTALKEMIISYVQEPESPRPIRRSGSGTQEAHLRAAFLSSSVTIPIKDAKPMLGPWQEVLVYDFDDKPGRREVLMQVMGLEKEAK